MELACKGACIQDNQRFPGGRYANLFGARAGGGIACIGHPAICTDSGRLCLTIGGQGRAGWRSMQGLNFWAGGGCRGRRYGYRAGRG